MYIPFSRSLNVSCNSGFSLLSCGIENNQLIDDEKYRQLIPMNSAMCECYDYFGAICVVWCYSGLVSNFRIVKTPVTGYQAGTVYATCPAGTYVIGCHPNPYHTAGAIYRGYYPSSSNTCTCRDSNGIQCIATCASNVRNHEIRTIAGSGTLQVVCSPPSVVLGCGVNPFGNGQNQFTTAFVVDQRTCECRDIYGTTCYAICGELY